MAELSSMHAIVHGYVQGVFFRAFIVEKARALGLTGYTCNASNGVEVGVTAEGVKSHLESLLDDLKQGPPNARVEKISVTWGKHTGKYSRFNIVR
jgi:acylphosphatase